MGLVVDQGGATYYGACQVSKYNCSTRSPLPMKKVWGGVGDRSNPGQSWHSSLPGRRGSSGDELPKVAVKMQQ